MDDSFEDVGATKGTVLSGWLARWMGGRINWNYNHLSPQLGLGIGAQLGKILSPLQVLEFRPG